MDSSLSVFLSSLSITLFFSLSLSPSFLSCLRQLQYLCLKAEVISERTDAFHKFLNLVAGSDKVRAA